MQGPQIGWEPQSFYPPPPWHVRLYLLFLIVIFMATIVRTARIACSLRRTTNPAARPGLHPKSCAELVLRGAYPHWIEKDLVLCRQTATYFNYIWNRLEQRTNEISRWIQIVLLSSVLLFTWEVLDAFQTILPMRVSVRTFLAASFQECCFRMTVGLSVCVAMYALRMCLSSILNRRRLGWERFCADRQEVVCHE